MLSRFSISLVTVVVAFSCATPVPELQEEVAPVITRFTYSNGDATYQYISHRIMDQEVAGQTTRNETAVRVLLSVTIAESDTSRTVQFFVDSILDATGPGFNQTTRRTVAGLRLAAPFQSTGAIGRIPDQGAPSTLMANVTLVIKTFFPKIPSVGVDAGADWVDTTEVTTNDGSTRITKRSVVYSTAGEWRDDNVLPVTWRSEYTLTGEGQQMGQEFTLSGGGNAMGEHLLSANGVFLSTASRDSSSAEVTLPTLGITVPIMQTAVDSVRIVR